MSVPGSNLLARAAKLIKQSPIVYLPYAARTVNAVGQWVTTYGKSRIIYGSFQPIPRNMFTSQGLDFNNSYANIYIQKNAIDIARDVSGDQFQFNGTTWQAMSRTEWYGIDGWEAILVIGVNNAG